MKHEFTKRTVSGLLALVTILSALIQPAAAFAEETETKPLSYEAEYPALEAVRPELAEEEIITAGDYEIEAGSSFEIEKDFSGMEIPEGKVTVRFHEAKNSEGKDFDRNHPDTYQAVYFVEPVSGHPFYHVKRSITVKERPDHRETGENHQDPSDSESKAADSQSKAAEPESKSTDSESQTSDPESKTSAPDRLEESDTLDSQESQSSGQDPEALLQAMDLPHRDSMTEAEMEAVMEDMERAEHTRQDAEKIAEDGGLLLFSMDPGSANAPRMARASGSATLETGRELSYPPNLGNYTTNYFTVNGRIAYCLESHKGTPGTGSYVSQVLESNPNLQKTLYYGFGGAGDLTDQFMPQFDGDTKYVFTHIAASYFYCGIEGFAGCTMADLEACGVLGWIQYLADQPAPPDPYLDLSKTALKARIDGSQQVTGVTTLEGDFRNQITLRLPQDVTFHNEDNGDTKTGGNVRISGGTSFYFTAPLHVSGKWDSGEMRGSIRNLWRALVVSTGDANQDIGSYYEETSGNSVRFLVEWTALAKVKVTKVDSISNARLSGAVFGIYREEACQNLITQLPPTNGNGEAEAELVKTQDTVYVKEITAPAGYRYNGTVYRAALNAGQAVSITVPDAEQLGSLTIYKEGEVLTGATTREDGVDFQYESRRLPGAVFQVYAAKDIVNAYGTVSYKAGQLVAENLETGADGSVTLDHLHLGTYRVVEVQAPDGYYNARETKDVEIRYAGQMAETAFSELTVRNERQKAEVRITKKDGDTGNGLAGGIFGLYAAEPIRNGQGTDIAAKDALLGTAVTDTEGNAAFSADLPLGFGYYVKEIQAPENYVKNEEDLYTFRFEYTNDREAKSSFFHAFTNQRVSAVIRLSKVDRETGAGVPQGDASLEHAVYGLYARKEIRHPDQKSGVLYQAGEQVAALTTDKEGKAEIGNLYLGEYFVKEITPPAGYLADEQEYDLVCGYEGELSASIQRECTSTEQVMKQPFQIIKAANNGESDACLLPGAGFTAYLVSSLTKKEDGSYDFASAEPVVIGADGATEMFTDENGYACSIPLPFGTYVVRETTTPENYKPVRDFLVYITEHKPDEPQLWRVLLDEAFEARLRIVKKDAETKQPVLIKNAEFKIYDLDREAYVEQVTTYPTTVTHQSFFTDEQGYLVLPQNLKTGHYRIEEVQAPEGYLVNPEHYEITIDSGMPYQIDGASGDVIMEAVCEDHPVKGTLRIAKTGESLEGFDQGFLYGEQPLSGVEFQVFAAEDIYTADGQKDGNGNRIREYAAGELVDTLLTDGKGNASLTDLPLGTYRIVETRTLDGYVVTEGEQTVTLAYADQDTPVVEQTAVFHNALQKARITAVKKDAENGAVLEGAVFGLYAKEDISIEGSLLVKADTLLGEAETDQDGRAVFDQNLPLGKYYIRELKAPAGYVTSDQTVEVTAEYQGQEIKTAEFLCEFENAPTTISIKKTDLTTGTELEGARLTVLDAEGNEVDRWTSVKGEEHSIQRLTVGGVYTLREELAPYGYLRAEEITFTVEDTDQVQKVEMKDDVPTGMLVINKSGELLEEVSLPDAVGGWFTHLFGYLTGSLQDVTFEVYASEDILAADGESTHYKKDELVAAITTDETGHAKLEGLPLGKYYIQEKETAQGYVLDGEIREADLTYRDQDTKVVTYSTDWQNQRQKVEIEVLKTEKDSERAVEGTVFSLCAKEEITNAEGKVLMEADTVIEEKATDPEGRLQFAADLPTGFAYYVKETAPAPGFTTEGEVQEIENIGKKTGSEESENGFQVEGEESEDQEMENEAQEKENGTSEIKIPKQEAESNVQSKDSQEQGSESTDSTAEKEVLSYALHFENAPTVLEFTKVSLTDGSEVEGAKLQVTDPDGTVVDEWISGKEPHSIRELEVGKTYRMTETLPAAGYVTAESIEFTVENTGEVQKVEMKDDVTKVEISKTDIAGKELPGAKLTIFNKEGEAVESWTSGSEPHYIEMLPIGEYTLHEETAPDGYLVAEDIRFEVRDTGEIQKVAMKDEVKPDQPTQPEEPEQPKPEIPSPEVPKPETPKPKPPVETPKTGDRTELLLWAAIGGFALIGMIVPMVSGFRKRKDNGQGIRK